MAHRVPVGLDPHHHLAGLMDQTSHQLMEATDAPQALEKLTTLYSSTGLVHRKNVVMDLGPIIP